MVRLKVDFRKTIVRNLTFFTPPPPSPPPIPPPPTDSAALRSSTIGILFFASFLLTSADGEEEEALVKIGITRKKPMSDKQHFMIEVLSKVFREVSCLCWNGSQAQLTTGIGRYQIHYTFFSQF